DGKMVAPADKLAVRVEREAGGSLPAAGCEARKVSARHRVRQVDAARSALYVTRALTGQAATVGTDPYAHARGYFQGRASPCAEFPLSPARAEDRAVGAHVPGTDYSHHAVTKRTVATLVRRFHDFCPVTARHGRSTVRAEGNVPNGTGRLCSGFCGLLRSAAESHKTCDEKCCA